MLEARLWNNTLRVLQMVGRTRQYSLLFQRGKGSLKVIGGIDVRLAHPLSGKLTEWNTIDKNNHLVGPGANVSEGQSCE